MDYIIHLLWRKFPGSLEGRRVCRLRNGRLMNGDISV